MRKWVPAAAVLALVTAASARAQVSAPPPAPSPAAPPSEEATDPDPDSADLSITGSVTYRELKFEQAGTPKVEFTGGVVAPQLGTNSKLQTVWHADRGSLPRPVQTGVLYRDNTVRLTITARFEDLARLFAEDAPAGDRPAPVPTPSPGRERQ